MANGLAPPAPLAAERTAAHALLAHYSPEDVVTAWAALLGGDDFDRAHLSLAYLTRSNRVGNILAGRYRSPGEDSHAAARPHSQRPPTDNPELLGLEKYSG